MNRLPNFPETEKHDHFRGRALSWMDASSMPSDDLLRSFLSPGHIRRDGWMLLNVGCLEEERNHDGSQQPDEDVKHLRNPQLSAIGRGFPRTGWSAGMSFSTRGSFFSITSGGSARISTPGAPVPAFTGYFLHFRPPHNAPRPLAIDGD